MDCHCAYNRAWKKTKHRTTVRGWTPWETVEDTLNQWGAVYGAPRAIKEAAKQLGVTDDALRLHIKRRGYVFPA